MGLAAWGEHSQLVQKLSSPRQPPVLHQNPITPRILLPKATLPGVLRGCGSNWDQFPASFLPVFPRGGAEPALRHPPAGFLSLETPSRSSVWLLGQRCQPWGLGGKLFPREKSPRGVGELQDYGLGRGR